MDGSRIILKVDKPSSPPESDKSSKLYWGPLVWRMLHLLAEVSDRRDIPLLWPQLMRLTSGVLPCEACRHHLATYLRTHNFMKVKNPHLITGAEVKVQARNELIAFHNDVNKRLGKPEFSQADYERIYITKTRGEQLFEVQKLYDEIKVIWNSLTPSRIVPVAYTSWKTHVNMMLALLAAGSL